MKCPFSRSADPFPPVYIQKHFLNMPRLNMAGVHERMREVGKDSTSSLEEGLSHLLVGRKTQGQGSGSLNISVSNPIYSSLFVGAFVL